MQLQGYDLVLQVTNEVFQPVLEQFFRIPGNEANEERQFPQELVFNQVSSTEGNLDLHAIVTGISMEFRSGNIVEIRMPFERSQWIIPNHPPASNLAGELVMLLPFTMNNVSTSVNGESVFVARLEIPDQLIPLEVELTPESYTILRQSWGYLPQAIDAFRNGIQGEVAQRIQDLFLPILLNDFPLQTNSGHGTLNPMRPRQLEAHTIYNSTHDRWDLAVMGMMISGKAPGQSAGFPSAINDRSRNIVAGISEEAINKLLLAAPLASALKVPVSQLPPEFGDGRPTLGDYSVVGRLSLDSLQTTLVPTTNTIRFDLDVYGTGDDTLLNSLTVDGNIRVGIGLENGALTTEFQGSSVNVDFDYTFLGHLVSGFGPIEATVEDMLNNLVRSEVQGALDGLVFDIPINFTADGLSGLFVSLDAIDICSSEAIALYGHVGSNEPPQAALPSLRLAENLVELTRTQIGTSHTYNVEDNAFCEFMREQTYILSDFDVEQKSTIRQTPRLLGKPIRYAWEIAGQTLSGTEGTIRFMNTVRAYDPAIPTGEEEIVGEKEVEVSYKIFDDRLELYNRPEDASHSFMVICIARDVDDESAIGFVWVDFQGKQGQGYRDFDRDLNECWAGIIAERPDPREYEIDIIYPIQWFIYLPLIPLCDPLEWGWIRIPGLLDHILESMNGTSIMEMNGHTFNTPILDFNPHTPHRIGLMSNPTYVSHMVRDFKAIEARYIDHYAFANPVKYNTGSHSHEKFESKTG